jgi:hypothetical protein
MFADADVNMGQFVVVGGKTALRKTLAFPQISRQVTNERCGAGGRHDCKPMLAEHGACKVTNDET